ncbi:MAG: M28 family peptidase [Oscillospiraceae bacterium]|nr:M28 family peptidase [Oscillospiraceae bacterium]
MQTTFDFHQLAERLFAQHPTRMWKKEKAPFLQTCTEEFAKLGYQAQVMEFSASGITSRNLVVGNPDAPLVFTAHYDTPGRTGFLMLGSRLWGAVGSQIALLAAVFLITVVIGFFNVPWLGLLITPLMLVPFFLKNKQNRNDNTSGVLAVFRMVELLADSPLRDNCAFVLFDHEEVGLLGSQGFARQHNRGTVINFDCVGTGDVLAVMARKKQQPLQAHMMQFLQSRGEEPAKINSILLGSSDHAHFNNAVSLLYYQRSRLGPLALGNVHSRRDTVCELAKITRLCDLMLAYVSA